MNRHDDGSSDLPSLRGEVESFFSEVMGLRPQGGPGIGIWNPHLDLLEEEDRFVLEMDLPGVRREDLRIFVEGRRVTVTGSREVVREAGGPRFRRRERSRGSFRRSVELPGEVDRDRVVTRLEEGILRLDLPKRRGGR